jgi:hypothetical protein
VQILAAQEMKMKMGKIVLALILGAGAVAAYYWFPDPLGDQVAAVQQAAADQAAAEKSGEKAAEAAVPPEAAGQ